MEVWIIPIRTQGSNPGLGRSPKRGNGNPLQYSCLKNLMNSIPWWATVHSVTKSQTWLSDRACTNIIYTSLWCISHSLRKILRRGGLFDFRRSYHSAFQWVSVSCFFFFFFIPTIELEINGLYIRKFMPLWFWGNLLKPILDNFFF